MWNDLIISVIVLSILLSYFKNKKLSYSLIIASLFIMPVLILGKNRVSSSYVWLLILIVLLVFNLLSKTYIVIPKSALLYTITASVLILLSVFSWIAINAPTEIGLNSFLGQVKNLVAFIAFVLLLASQSEKDFLNILYYGLFITGVMNLFAVALQVAGIFNVKLFYDLYWTLSNTPLQSMLKIGHFVRGYGTFGSSVQLGAVSLLSYSLGVGEYIRGEYTTKWFWLAAIWFFVGLASLSKTFIVGSVFITLLIFIVTPFVYKSSRKRIIRRGLSLLTLVAAILVSGYFILNARGFYASFYYGYLLKPLSSIASRYSFANSEILFHETFNIISKYPIFGVGFQSLSGEFIGDSSYVVILHNSGFVGSAVSILFILYVFHCIIKYKIWKVIYLFIALLGASLALPILFCSVYQIPFLFHLLYAINYKIRVESQTRITSNKKVQVI